MSPPHMYHRRPPVSESYHKPQSPHNVAQFDLVHCHTLNVVATHTWWNATQEALTGEKTRESPKVDTLTNSHLLAIIGSWSRCSKALSAHPADLKLVSLMVFIPFCDHFSLSVGSH